jgi:hypothetical protein
MTSPMNITRRRLALLAAAVAWLPLAAFSLAQTRSVDVPGAFSFWRDVSVHARYLISVPLFILGDAYCVPRLWRIIEYFPKAALIGDLERFAAAVASGRRGFDSRRAFIGLGLAACVSAAAIARSHPVAQVPEWQLATGSSAPYSAAGWWHILVSLPIGLLLLFIWLWRLWVWAHLLRRIARCQLQLVASHPDRSAGLGFLGASLRAFAPVAFAFSTITASREAQIIISHRAPTSFHLYFNVGISVFIMVLIVLPLCAFTPALMRAARRGRMTYGTLALQVGQAFERRWLAEDAPRVDEDALHASDFSATIDLYSIVAGAHGVRIMPVGRWHLLRLAVVLAIPFVPVLLLMVPLHVIWPEIWGLLF